MKYELAITISVFLYACGQQSSQTTVLTATDTTSHTITTVTEQAVLPKKVFNINRYKANQVTEIGAKVLSIVQDKADNYWFGTNSGAYFYNGKNLFALGVKDGLFQNQVQDIQEDSFGNFWFATGGYGVNCFTGDTILSFLTTKEAPVKSNWKTEKEDLWFYAGGGAFRYYRDSFSYLAFPKPEFDSKYLPNPPYHGSAYGVYCTLKDRTGNVWFGTQSKGVCCYDGRTFTWHTNYGLRGPAVLALFEDRAGNIWIGTNGTGLFCYDGKTLSNVTEEKGLSNPEFIKAGKSGPGTLARVWCINEDNAGNIWIGTGDAGVWRYDGRNLINYKTENGLPGSGIETIYKDKKGGLWFGTDGDGVFKFNGINFIKFTPEIQKF